MKLYVSDIEESYKDTIVGHLINSGTEDLLVQILGAVIKKCPIFFSGFAVNLCARKPKNHRQIEQT